MTAVEATAVEVSTKRRDAETLMAEARDTISPRMVLHHPRPTREAEAEGQSLVPLMAEKVSMTLGTVSMSITLTTLAPSAFQRESAKKKTPRGINLKLPGNLKHYDNKERPETWISNYYNAVDFAGGNTNIACRILQLHWRTSVTNPHACRWSIRAPSSHVAASGTAACLFSSRSGTDADPHRHKEHVMI
jgi:hypothetical protein